MKSKLILLFAFFCSMQMAAVNIIVHTTDNAQQLHDVALIGKWVFMGDELQLLDKSGSVLASELIQNIRKITFATSLTTAVEDVESDAIVVYPNPTQDVLYVKGTENTILRVYDMQGQLLQTAEGDRLTVSSLSTGTYLLQIGTQVVRFIKR